MAAEGVTAAVDFRRPVVASFLAAGITLVICDAPLGPRRYPRWFIKAFFIGWNLVVIMANHDDAFCLALGCLLTG